jgi:hypothetical protein
MPTTLENKVRKELCRERRLLDALRADPMLLKRELRDQHGEIIDRLDATYERAADAIERIGEPGTAGRKEACDEFLEAWSELTSRVRLVRRERVAGPMRTTFTNPEGA